MPTTADFLTATQWAGITTLLFGAIAILGFVLKWGIRFRLVGATGFLVVLTVGLFGLSLVPIIPTTVPGSIRYATVYDSGAAQAVIVVPASITEPQLAATLQQAGSNLFSPGRLGGGSQLLVRARTVIHPEPGVSVPLYLGQVTRSLINRDDDQMEIVLYPEAIAQLPPAPPAPVQASESSSEL